MTDIDKRLEELVALITRECGCDESKAEYIGMCVHDTEAADDLGHRAPALAAALLRARKALAHGYSGMPGCACDADEKYTCWRHAALADTELEEALE